MFEHNGDIVWRHTHYNLPFLSDNLPALHTSLPGMLDLTVYGVVGVGILPVSPYHEISSVPLHTLHEMSSVPLHTLHEMSIVPLHTLHEMSIVPLHTLQRCPLSPYTPSRDVQCPLFFNHPGSIWCTCDSLFLCH